MIRRYRVHIFIHAWLATILCAHTIELMGRSIYRPTAVPQLITRWVDEETTYQMQHSGLEQPAIFDQYDPHHFTEWLLPDGDITIRDAPDGATVSGALLKEYLEEILKALQTNTEREIINKHFTILKDRDYNSKTRSGLIVLRFKEYPFVVKLFMETPQSFVAPFTKGFEPCCFFVMSGGASRYLLGFTRIKNREAITKIIEQDPHWHDKISTPRKWFWQPTNNRWFEVRSKHLGTLDRTITLPGVYAIVCDAVDAEPFAMTNKDDRKFGIELSHFFGTRIDSHINNFLVENKTGKIVVIDTEHFATQVGLREPMEFDGYVSWYWQLATKCIGNGFFRTKKERLLFQKTPPPIVTD